MKHWLLVFIVLYFVPIALSAQDLDRVIVTSVPFLLVNPDARANSFGNISTVAANPSAGLFGNPALLNQGEGVMGAQVSAMAWTRAMAPGSNIYNAGAYFPLGDFTTIAYNYHHFQVAPIHIFLNLKPEKEFAHNLRVSRSFTENFSVGAGFKYFKSIFETNSIIITDEWYDLQSYAFDVGLRYNSNLQLAENQIVNLQLGAHIEKIGPDVGYFSSPEYPLPTNLNLGLILSLPDFSDRFPGLNANLAYQAQRYLISEEQSSIWHNSVKRGVYTYMPLLKERIKVTHQVGGELIKEKDEWVFALRAGHFNEHRESGNRKLITYGLGGGYKFLHLDLFYWQVVGNPDNSPFANTLGITMGAKHNIEGGLLGKLRSTPEF